MADAKTMQNIVNAVNTQRQKNNSAGNLDYQNDIDISNRTEYFRTPFTMTTVARQKDNTRIKLAFRCNPSQVSMSFPQRGGTQDVKGGKVFYYWKNQKKKSHFDLPAFTYTFQTGNIRPFIMSASSTNSVPGGIYLPEGLNNYYEWMSMYDEDKILADGSPNFVIIEHRSSIFPYLQLQGFFEPNSLGEIVEEATNSPTFSWTAKFLVHSSQPEINSDAFRTRFKNIYLEKKS